MLSRVTPTLAICLTGGLAAGLALARPATTNDQAPVADTAVTDTLVTDTLVTGIEVVDEVVAEEVAGVDQSPDQTPTGASTAMIIADFAFSTVTARAGTTVTVDNSDAAPHTATSSVGLFDTGNVAANSSGAFTAPSTPGTYALFCAIHPSMQGQLIVT